MSKAKTALALAIVLALPLVQAQTREAPPSSAADTRPSGAHPYAQDLVDAAARRHPELLAVDLHAMLPGATQSAIVASTLPARLGHPSDIDDIAVFRSGQPRVEINHRGDQNVEVAVPLFDIFKQTIGSVEFTLRYVPGTDEAALVEQASQYRDEMSRRILDLASLADPSQLDPRVPTHTYAQFLIDDALARHPEVEVLALHGRSAAVPGEYPIIASNIGRIGKPADPSDLAVIQSGQPHGEADVRGARYEWKIPLADAAGKTLGTLAVIFPYRRLSRPDDLRQQAEKIASELGQRIASAQVLNGPYPPIQPGGRVEAIEEYNKQELGNKQNLPMTKEVASGQALAQTQDGYSEAIKNVAGVQPTNSAGSSNDAFAIRGIKLNLFSNYRLDGGLPVTGVITNPTENKVRVETLKGANALMFGVASPAGIINFVTKRAGDRDVTTVGLAGNAFGQYGAAIDIGRRFGEDKRLGVRLNGSATHLENGVHDLQRRGLFRQRRRRPARDRQTDAAARLRVLHASRAGAGGNLAAAGREGRRPDHARAQPEKPAVGKVGHVHAATPSNTQVRADYALSDGWKVLGAGGIFGIAPPPHDRSHRRLRHQHRRGRGGGGSAGHQRLPQHLLSHRAAGPFQHLVDRARPHDRHLEQRARLGDQGRAERRPAAKAEHLRPDRARPARLHQAGNGESRRKRAPTRDCTATTRWPHAAS